MDIYQIILAGYDPSTDETDHLIKWVATTNGTPYIAILEEIYGKNMVVKVEPIPEYTVDVAGIDLIITKSSIFTHHALSNGNRIEKLMH